MIIIKFNLLILRNGQSHRGMKKIPGSRFSRCQMYRRNEGLFNRVDPSLNCKILSMSTNDLKWDVPTL